MGLCKTLTGQWQIGNGKMGMENGDGKMQMKKEKWERKNDGKMGMENQG